MIEKYKAAKKAKVGDTIQCPYCGNSFTKKTYQHIFCASNGRDGCKIKFMKKSGLYNGMSCPSCGGYKYRYSKLCRKCRDVAGWPKACLGKKGSNHPAWKGGMVVHDGYLRTYDPTHQYPRKGGYVLEHVRIMEINIGRRLLEHECVHHINGDRLDNRLSNLELTTFEAHSKHHAVENLPSRERDAHGRFSA